MGILTDFFIATPDELANLEDASSPAQQLQGILAKRVDQVKIAKLDGILRGVPFTDSLRSLELIKEASEDGPWTTTIPPQLTAALAALTDDQAVLTAQQWATAEEFAADLWTPADVADFLSQLRALARSAVATRREMYHWLCL